MKLLLLGATGLVGNKTLSLALANPACSEVIAPTRKPLPPNDRLVNPVARRLDELIPALMLTKPDAVICTLGTTMAKAGSQEAFLHVDRELPVAFGKAAHAAGVQTYALVSAMGAREDSRSFYYRTKGAVEKDLQEIGFHSLTICRPSLIEGDRTETRVAERIGLVAFRLLGPLLPKKLRVNPAECIAAALLEAVVAAKPGCHWVYADEMH